MTDFLIQHFVPQSEDTQDHRVRTRYGALSGGVGIGVNVLLFAGKLLAGLLSGSVAIMADAINNLSDAGSSVISLLGFKLAEKPADKDHPFGHGRTEYVAGLIVAFLIMLLGVQLGMSSLQKVLHPEPVNAGWLAVGILFFSILMKLWLFRFNRQVGRRIQSPAILATAQDSLNDVVATAAVLVATVVSALTPLELDGWMGLLVAAFILYSGIGVVKDTLDPLLGQAPDTALVNDISRTILGYEGVLGLHDLVVHNYGPGRIFASVHVEVSSSVDILVSHDRIDNIERDFAQKKGIFLVAHLDPLVVNDARINALRQLVLESARQVYAACSVHDFRAVLGESHSNLIFDVAVPIDCPLQNTELCHQIEEQVQKTDPHLYCVITVDRGYQTDYGAGC
ncbi:cation diffusion facilitator family transporter [Neobittarella massiliensis]|uniref:cation diffusion facilitator family transporter n=1 Tax=Neobittarella massiliensis (ex Bilen et al. 2018) TaxID=2041842 RepID=UPI000CF71D86|nr:cation diffusion facilitator family transporter [Neobittarella massiliensis]